MGYNTLQGSVSSSAAFQVTKSVTGQAAIPWSPALAPAASFSAAGTTTAGTANLAEPLNYTIAGGGNQSIDLTSIVAALLGTITFARVKTITISHDSASLASSITWDTTQTNSLLGWITTGTPKITLAPGEFITLGGSTALGKVVDSTHKIVYIKNDDGSNAATVKIFITGADA